MGGEARYGPSESNGRSHDLKAFHESQSAARSNNETTDIFNQQEILESIHFGACILQQAAYKDFANKK